MPVLMPEGRQSFEDSAGAPLVGGKLYTYSAGTNTPLATYSDALGTTPNTNPIILDARGEAVVFWSGAYKIKLTDANDVVIWTQDDVISTDQEVSGIAADLQAFITSLANPSNPAEGDALVAVKKTTTGSVATTQHEVNERTICTFDYMSAAQKADVLAGGFSIDCRAAVQAAITAARNGGVKRIYAPGKGYLINGVASTDSQLNGLVFPLAPSLNADPADQLIFQGDGMGTVFRCGTAGMIMFRISANCTILRDVTIDGNALSNTWGVGVVPESMTQTTTLANQSLVEIINVGRVNLTEGIVYQPGPRVSGSDSGIFYLGLRDGYSNNNTRHFWSKKGATWAVDVNRITRMNIYNQRFTRGNAGLYLEVGSEVKVDGLNCEFINSGTSPCATPTARYNGVDCSNIIHIGGYDEACSLAFDAFANNVASWGYTPASGSDLKFRTYCTSWVSNVDDNKPWIPVIQSAGGGTAGASSSTGMETKSGKIVAFNAQINQAKAGLSAGAIFISGFPFASDAAWTPQPILVSNQTGITLAAPYTSLGAYLQGSNIILQKLSVSGAAPALLQLADITGANLVLTLQGSVKAN